MKRRLARALMRLADRLDGTPEFSTTEAEFDQMIAAAMPVQIVGPPLTWGACSTTVQRRDQ